MLVFIIRRLLYAPFLLFGVALITFIVFNVVGGNPVYTLAGKNATPRQIHELTHEYGFDRPLFLDLSSLWRGIHAEELTASAATLMASGARGADLAVLQSQVVGLYDEYDRVGAGFDRGKLIGFRQAVEASGISVDAVSEGDDVEAQLNLLSQAVLAATSNEAERRRAAILVLRRELPLAVPELVQLATGASERETQVLASYELETLVFQDFAILASDSAAVVDGKVDRIRAWWADSAEDYDYEFDVVATIASLGRSQFVRYLKEVYTFEFGESYKKRGKPVIEIIKLGAPVSLILTIPPFLLGTLLGVLIGLVSAFHQGQLIDRGVVVGSVLGMSISILVFVIVGQLFLAYRLGWFPVAGYEPGLGGLRYFFLPWTIWILAGLGADVRFFRTAMVDELGKDYIRTARAKGLSNAAVMLKHLLKNSMIPILTYVIIALPYLYTGSLVLEKYFGIPGLGKETVEAVLSSDFPVIKALTLIGSLLYILADILTNIAYAVVDPRVRLG